MSGYLQRLFDRGAGFAARPPSASTGDVTPAMAPASPAIGFDQRLADPDLAQVFGILGVSPDSDALLETAPREEAIAPLVVPRTSRTPADSIAPRSSMASASQSMPPAMPQRGSIEKISEAERTAPRAVKAAPPRTVAEGIEPFALQPETRIPTVEPHPIRSPPPRVEFRESAPVPRADGADPSSSIAASRDQVEPPARTFSHAPRDERESVAQPGTRVRTAPSSPALPPEILPERSAARSPVREVEPPRRQPAPLEPSRIAAADTREVERIVREAVRAELAHRPAVGPDTGHRRSAAPTDYRDGAQKPAPRPASAREASVIGELEPSSSPLTIYGLRRR